MSSTSKEISFNKTFIKRNLKLMVPILLSQMLLVAVGFVDNFMITQYDSAQDHLIAVGAGAEMWFGMSSLYMAVGAVFGTLYSQFNSNRDTKNFEETFKVNIHFTIYLMFITSLIMYFLAPQLMHLFFLGNSYNRAEDLSIDYLKIMAIGNIFVSISYLLTNPLLMMGKAKYMLYITLVSLFTNFIFDYIFIYTIDLGSSGAAWSTVISYFIQLLISSILFWKNRNHFIVHTWWKLDSGILKLIIRRSWMIFTISALNISLVATTMLWTSMYGAEMMKSASIAYAISGILFTIFPAAGQSVKIVIGGSLGKSEFTKAKIYSVYLFRIIMLVAIPLSLIGIASAFILPDLLLNEKVYADHSKAMILAFSIAFFGFLIISYYMAVLEAGGHTLLPTIINYFSQLWLIIPLGIILGPWCIDAGFDLNFWITQCSSFIIALLAYIVYKRDKWLVNLNEHKLLKEK